MNTKRNFIDTEIISINYHAYLSKTVCLVFNAPTRARENEFAYCFVFIQSFLSL